MMKPNSRLALAIALVFAMEGEAVCGASEPSFYDYGPAPEFTGVGDELAR
jgi:hypothetical protein